MHNTSNLESITLWTNFDHLIHLNTDMKRIATLILSLILVQAAALCQPVGFSIGQEHPCDLYFQPLIGGENCEDTYWGAPCLIPSGEEEECIYTLSTGEIICGVRFYEAGGNPASAVFYSCPMGHGTNYEYLQCGIFSHLRFFKWSDCYNFRIVVP